MNRLQHDFESVSIEDITYSFEQKAVAESESNEEKTNESQGIEDAL
ncbi:MAG: hypothetical protein QX199_07605 [Methylococcaceae bacterium]